MRGAVGEPTRFTAVQMVMGSRTGPAGPEDSPTGGAPFDMPSANGAGIWSVCRIGHAGLERKGAMDAHVHGMHEHRKR